MVAVFNSMTFALKVTPLAVRALSEGAVAVKRFQVRDMDKSVTEPPTFLLPNSKMVVMDVKCAIVDFTHLPTPHTDIFDILYSRHMVKVTC